MSDLDLQQVLSSRYKTSLEADSYTDRLRQNLALETKAQVARLAIGRSLAMGKLPDSTIDGQGRDIPASSLFTPDNIGAWVGLVVTQSLVHGGPVVDSMDGLRLAIRAHWHRGALSLWSDWKASDENYDKFIETLVERRSDMPEVSSRKPVNTRDAASINGGKAPEDVSTTLMKALDELGIKVQVKDAIHGPRITRYRVLLMNLVDSAKLKRSMSQLGLAMNLGDALPTVANGDEAKTVFIDLPRLKDTWKTVGIERLRAWAHSGAHGPNQLMVYVGVLVTGEDLSFDLAAAPHLLVGGTTGSGKSVCLHSLLLSLLLRHTPDTLQLALIDPKQVEFRPYAKLPNLYGAGIATEVVAAREMLEGLVVEMETRYGMFNRLGVNSINDARHKGQELPYIVVCIEEMADLVMQDQNIEPLIARLAQKARAAGVHLVLATQRPDAKIFTGLIRSNIPGRIALTVQKGTESTIILDETGAENLLGQGDMLLKLPGEPQRRAHGVFLKPEQVMAAIGKKI
ncbi:FtsK/SpoIIIE domain-containing protein [Acidovorax sp. NCPPB 3859]|nr:MULTISPECIES: DNA translocase FtsK [unclassified Acidovorax]MDA8450667.1 FtsK/SpoIIIE domain-containing protein [Acidovorax sp. GBBC 3297]MDA8460248.1 FtsK/SpoIIIE domain-containing protein [Acidovorax sp. GBBC 3333]MDA8465148.1 FtsK/SpoIIIE domain-containing protein [Acidovorax sp. GBBC 3332]MDA8470318.1 FtsK/SpoIIIE domain-containing protein [Acidovorax sp. GBBC 3299]WCM80717.1 FtsK/SpoIIIE domain-containing protein [Acidovorax sp. GBBC 712]